MPLESLEQKLSKAQLGLRTSERDLAQEQLAIVKRCLADKNAPPAEVLAYLRERLGVD